jgi:catechol 2,3-dioxygenase-like lactoylglutathione lyase family enzyme
MLQHVTLEITAADADRAVEFFSLVGFKEVAVPDTLGSSFRWMEREGTQVHLMFVTDPVAPPHGHAAIVVPDHAEAKRRLLDAGFEVQDRRRHWAADRAFATAPGGHRVELMAAPPPRGTKRG